jgi:hypothetical protein
MEYTITFSEAAGKLMVTGIPLGGLTRVAAALASKYPQKEERSGAEAGAPPATVHSASLAELEAVVGAQLRDDEVSFQSENDRQEFAFDRFELHQVVDS